jgi:hypothetical protein
MLPQIGTDLPFPQGCVLRVGKSYPNFNHLMINTCQMQGQTECLKLIMFELVLEEIKHFMPISSGWKNKRKVPQKMCIIVLILPVISTLNDLLSIIIK